MDCFFDYIRWQDLFLIGTLPIFLVAFIYFFVEESSVWQEAKNEKKENLPIIPVIIKNWPVCIYAIILMTCFNFFSHGTQDVYPLFLKDQHHFTTHTVSIIAILYNIASIIGGVSFGTLSQKIGRPQAMTLAAFFALCAVPLWAFFKQHCPHRTGSFYYATYGARRMGNYSNLSHRINAKTYKSCLTWCCLSNWKFISLY